VQTILKKIVKFYEKLSCYIKSLKLSNGQFLIHSTIKNTRFLGIMIAIKNVIDIFRKYVEDLKLLNFVSCYKLNQNHLELFFCNILNYFSITSCGGYNNNPTCRQFITAYKQILIQIK